MWFLLVACSLATPSNESRLQALSLDVRPEDVAAALAHAKERDVSPSATASLDGRWTSAGGLPDLAVQATMRRREIQPGVVSMVGVVDSTIDGELVISHDIRVIEVYGGGKVCSFHLAHEERAVGSVDAESLEILRAGHHLPTLNELPCERLVAVTEDVIDTNVLDHHRVKEGASP